MIVLDEQLALFGADRSIKIWYKGIVIQVNDLRVGSVIKDEAVPMLLLQRRLTTFVTINERDFWRRISPHARYCVICFALSSQQIDMLPDLLHRVLRHPNFRTKAQRMGHVLRVTQSSISYYNHLSPQIRTLPLP